DAGARGDLHDARARPRVRARPLLRALDSERHREHARRRRGAAGRGGADPDSPGDDDVSAGGGEPGAPAPQARRLRGRRCSLDRRKCSSIIAALVVARPARPKGALSMTDQNDLLRRAAHVLPGGVLGNHRNGAGLEFVVKEGRGAYLSETNGRRYLDYLLGPGPMLLGHAHPAVVEAVRRQVERGTSYMLLNEPAIELAEEICRAVPCAEQVRYTSSGSEATFFALRVARAFRRRDKILKFEGGFHGTHDYSLMSVGPKAPKAFPAPTPDSAGIPHAVTDDVLIAPFNDLAETEAIIAAHHESLAAVIMEPFQRLIIPDRGFLAGVREITRRYGLPLIFDEIVTGFRFAYGGAQEYYGVVPDLAAVGKIIGGGFPLAAVVGRGEVMRHLAPAMEATGELVRQAGSLHGNPVAE